MSAPSAPQLVFEGPDPERLLLEAWSVHGTQVRITEPVVVRRGGVAGFFAKAHYRIEVLPTPDEAPTTGAAVPAGPAGALAGDGCLETVVASPYAPRHAAPTSVADDPGAPSAPVLPLVRPEAAPPRPPAPPAPAQLDPAAAGTRLGAPATSDALAELVAATKDEVNLHSSRRPSFDEVLEKVAGSLGEDPGRLNARLPTDLAPAVVGAGPTRLAASPPRSAGAGANAGIAPLAAATTALALPGDAVLAAPGAGHDDATLQARQALGTQLELVGFPQSLLAGAPASPRSLLEAFALAPAPRLLPKTPGSLVAVVGSLAVARGVAAQLGLPATEVARARRARTVGEAPSSHLVHDEHEAADLAPGWRRDRVGVVALTLTSLSRDGAWARAMLRAMAPSMTIALASATMKGEDVQAFCAAIGGVDALVVEDLEATLTPAAVLGTGIPVGMLDGMPADPATWVDVATRALARRSATEA